MQPNKYEFIKDPVFGSASKETACGAVEDLGLITEAGRSPEEDTHGNLYSGILAQRTDGQRSLVIQSSMGLQRAGHD